MLRSCMRFGDFRSGMSPDREIGELQYMEPDRKPEDHDKKEDFDRNPLCASPFCCQRREQQARAATQH